MKWFWDIFFIVFLVLLIFFGDEFYLLCWIVQLGLGCLVNLSVLMMLLYVGVYVDVLLYYVNDVLSVVEVDLVVYIGFCCVIYVIGCGLLICIEYLMYVVNVFFEWVLVCCNEWVDEIWNLVFIVYVFEIVEWLVVQGVKLIGLDMFFVDFVDSKMFDSY